MKPHGFTWRVTFAPHRHRRDPMRIFSSLLICTVDLASASFVNLSLDYHSYATSYTFVDLVFGILVTTDLSSTSLQLLGLRPIEKKPSKWAQICLVSQQQLQAPVNRKLIMDRCGGC